MSITAFSASRTVDNFSVNLPARKCSEERKSICISLLAWVSTRMLQINQRYIISDIIRYQQPQVSLGSRQNKLLGSLSSRRKTLHLRKGKLLPLDYATPVTTLY